MCLEELTMLKHNLNQKLEVGATFQAQGNADTEKCISGVGATKAALLCLLKERHRQQENATDTGSRSKRKNTQIDGVAAYTKADLKFVEHNWAPLTQRNVLTNAKCSQISVSEDRAWCCSNVQSSERPHCQRNLTDVSLEEGGYKYQ